MGEGRILQPRRHHMYCRYQLMDSCAYSLLLCCSIIPAATVSASGLILKKEDRQWSCVDGRIVAGDRERPEKDDDVHRRRCEVSEFF